MPLVRDHRRFSVESTRSQIRAVLQGWGGGGRGPESKDQTSGSEGSL